MTEPHSTLADAPRSTGRVYRSGALAGAATVLLFTVVHQLTISDIWFSLVPMLVIGVLCGMALAGSYRAVFDAPSLASWVAYSAAYLAALLLMGALSVVVFEPVTTATALMASGGPPPPELIGQALPFTGVFTLAAAGAISLAWGRSWKKAGAILATTVTLVFLFGLNISIIGLVEMTGEGNRALAEFLGLTAMILAANTAFFAALERRGLLAPAGAGRDGGGPEAVRAEDSPGAV